MKRLTILFLFFHLYCAPITDTFHKYFWANYQQFNKNYTNANFFYDPIVSNPSSPYIYKGYVHYLHETQQWKKIVDLINSIDTIFQDDMEVQMIFAAAFEQLGNQQACDERLIKLYNKFKNNMDLSIATIQMYVRRKEPENALKVIEEFLSKSPDKPNNFVFYFLKSQIFVQMNKRKEALESIKKSLELYPKFDKSWLLLAILEEQAGRIEQAVQGYMHFLQETNEPKGTIKNHLSQLILKYKIVPGAYSPKNDCFEEAQRLKQQQKYDDAFKIIESCLKKEPQNDEYRLFKIDLLMAQGQSLQAATTLKEWILENPTNELFYETLFLLNKTGFDKQRLITIFKEIQKNQPNNPLPVMYLADLYIRTNHAYAERYLKKAASLTKDTMTKIKTLYQLALIYYSKRQFSEAKKILLSIYDLKKDFLPALNLLAYYYASKEKNLSHGFMLIEQVLVKDPTNPHYLDTKAFILYKQGNYQQARAILEKCFTMESNDTTILRHLAKTMYQLGNSEQARSLIAKSLTLVNNQHEKKKLTQISQRWNNGSSK